ncbi:MAG: gliding motility-associated C-terminal domain-containing protein, partial [Bacteroidales bacterium]|nr:gliding motility-associated C-terminal domain-containing protein [Bacteroidales bacterium]
ELLNNLKIPDTVTVCWRDTLRFELQDSTLLEDVHNSLTYKWCYVGRTDTTKNPFFVFPNTGDISGEIWVEITDNTQENCKDTFNIIVKLPLPPTLVNPKEMLDTILCLNDTIRLTIAEVKNADFFSWEVVEIYTLPLLGNDSIQNIFFDSEKKSVCHYYYVVTFRNNNCFLNDPNPQHLSIYRIRDTVAKIFFANPPIVNLGPDTTFCNDGSGLGLIALDDKIFDVDEYKFCWNDDDKNDNNTFAVSIDNKGIQFVKVWNELCQKKDSILYTVFDTIDVDFWPLEWTNAYRLISDTAVRKNVRVELDASAEENAGTPTTYHWSVDTTKIHDPIRVVPIGTYTVVLRDSAGCERTFPVNITEITDEDCDKSDINMPNVFTPNDDGINDYFKPISVTGDVHNFRMWIYNRWGRSVFDFNGDPTNDLWKGWDGGNAPEGVYFWVIKYDDACNKSRQKRGTVTLLR